MTQPRVPISLDQLHVDEPCHAAWESMQAAGESRRHCESCAKHVHDLSAMSRDDVQMLLATSGELPCVRFERGADGRVLTREDFSPPSPMATNSVTTRRSWLRRAAAIAAAMGIGSLFNVGCDRSSGATTGIVAATQPTGPNAPPPGRPLPVGRAVLGEPVAADMPPSTRPTACAADVPPVSARTMGAIAPRR